MQKALMLPLILISMLPGCGLSVGGPRIVTPSAAACSALLPPEWRQGVPGADLPADASNMGDWISFADAQTGRLDQANGRTHDAIGIVERCESRDAAAVRQATRHRLFGLF